MKRLQQATLSTFAKSPFLGFVFAGGTTGREASKTESTKNYLTACAATALLCCALSGCGGGGGGGMVSGMGGPGPGGQDMGGGPGPGGPDMGGGPGPGGPDTGGGPGPGGPDMGGGPGPGGPDMGGGPGPGGQDMGGGPGPGGPDMGGGPGPGGPDMGGGPGPGGPDMGDPPLQNPTEIRERIQANATELVRSDMLLFISLGLDFEELFRIERVCPGGLTCTLELPPLIEALAETAISDSESVEEAAPPDAEITRKIIPNPGGDLIYETLEFSTVVEAEDDGPATFIESDYIKLGGWLNYSWFEALAFESHSSDGVSDSSTAELVFSEAMGQASGTNPASSLGGAIWNGNVVAVDSPQNKAGPSVSAYHGDAQLTVDLNALLVDVQFRNMKTPGSVSGGPVDFGFTSVPLQNGRFTTQPDFADHYLDGHFFGPEHEEAAGIFEARDLVGAFGVWRP